MSLIVSGEPDQRYDLLVRVARRQDLVEGKTLAGNLQQGEMDVFSFQGKPGDFRLLEVEKKGDVVSRLKFSPLGKKSKRDVARSTNERPEILFLPVASRGGRLRFAAILGREGRYQLQLLAGSPVSYKLTSSDPTLPIEWGGEVARQSARQRHGLLQLQGFGGPDLPGQPGLKEVRSGTASFRHGWPAPGQQR